MQCQCIKPNSLAIFQREKKKIKPFNVQRVWSYCWRTQGIQCCQTSLLSPLFLLKLSGQKSYEEVIQFSPKQMSEFKILYYLNIHSATFGKLSGAKMVCGSILCREETIRVTWFILQKETAAYERFINPWRDIEVSKGKRGYKFNIKYIFNGKWLLSIHLLQ